MIRWITAELGTAPFDQLGAVDEATAVLDVRDLVDRGGNIPADAGRKLRQALELLDQGRRVVICCDYGMSRSNALAAGVLARRDRIPFNDAVRRVIAATGQAAIKIEVLDVVRAALASGPGREAAPEPAKDGRRVLVTGGSGFLGRAFLAACPGHIAAIAPTRRELDLLTDAVGLDLLAKEQGVEAILHLANPRVYTTNQSMGEGLVLLKNALDVCRGNRLRLIYLSSWEVYSGYRSTGLRAAEDLPRLPKGTYGEAKDLCERLIEHHHRAFGVPYTLLRPGPVYGPGSDRPRFIYNFFDKAVRGEPIVAHRFRNGHPHLDLLFIGDLTAALIAAVDRRPDGAFNLGTGAGTSTTRVAELIVELVGSSSAVEHRPIHEYAPNIVMDACRAAAVLGWHPRTAVADGLRITLRGPCA
jgi:nucleoside-diphosphate-sugar epimerase